MDNRICKKCGELKPLTVFPKHKDCAAGRAWICRQCVNANQRVRRAADGNADTKRYEKTPNGFLMRVYRNMQSRVTGVQRLKAHLYLGKSLLPREQFREWAHDQYQFWLLFDAYEKAGYDRKLAPTVDRIDSSKGYEVGNMEWVTHSENSRRGAVSKRRLK